MSGLVGGGGGAGAAAYRSPSAGLAPAALHLSSAPKSPIQVSPSAHVPANLSPPVATRSEPDPVMDPAWYKQVHANDAPPDFGDDPATRPYARGGSVANPTDAQKKAGNYRKGHVNFHGLDISIETAKGQIRRGESPSGRIWSVKMPADYGYVKRTEGADGDHVDVFIGPHKDSHNVFIINQRHHITGKFDEHKAMLGYRSEAEACADYCKAFSDGKGPRRIQSVETVSIDAFKKWLKSGKTTKTANGKSIVDHAIRHVMGRHSRG